MNNENEDVKIILHVSHIKKYFDVSSGLRKSRGQVKALDDVTFSLREGETVGIVGETGCGKTTLGRSVLRLIEPTSGDVYMNLPREIMNRMIGLEGELSLAKDKLSLAGSRKKSEDDEYSKDVSELETKIKTLTAELVPLRKKYSVTKIRRHELVKYRKLIQPVFQDPYSSLDPRMLVKDVIAEPMRLLTDKKESDIFKETLEIIQEIGLSEDHLYRFPHEFSGGQRQRIGIARSLVIKPKILVLDEPTSALDVSVQAQILNMMRSIQRDRNISFIFISHHLSVIRMMSDRVAVMYLGKIVEMADTDALFTKMLHPYTKALLSAIPVPDPNTKMDRIILEGEIPSPSNPPTGCHFHTRCPVAMKNCGWSASDMAQPLREMLDTFRNREANAFPNIQEIVSDDVENTVEIEFQDNLSNPEAMLNAFKALIDKESNAKGGVKFKAVGNVSLLSPNTIVISLIEYDTPTLREISKDHFVSCLIYEKNANVISDAKIPA